MLGYERTAVVTSARAFQDIAANFMAGVLMAIDRPFRVGDLMTTSARSSERSLLRCAAVSARLDGMRFECLRREPCHHCVAVPRESR